MAYDVRARIRKTGEERIYPEKVFENICDDVDNPLEFVELVESPADAAPQFAQQQTVQQPETHSQLLVDAILKERQEKQELLDRIKQLEANQKKPKKAQE